MIHYHKVEQGSEEWHELRKNKLTGSNATPIGANGAGLKTYCKEVALGSQGLEEEAYMNEDMIRGNELESVARQCYELEQGVTTRIIGFVTNDQFKNVGVSPDALIGEDGGLEIKARNNKKHYSLIVGETKEIPFNQIQMCLMVTGRKWWDFVSFNPNLSKPIFIKRIYPDLEYHAKLKEGIKAGNRLINQYKKSYELYK